MASTGAVGLVAVFVVDLINLFYISRLGEQAIAAAVGFAYVQPRFAAIGSTFSIDNGRTLLAATVVESPFYRKK
jgi:hypothetical protein